MRVWCTLSRMPRPKSLTEDQIAHAALSVIEEDGLDALSMRTVAERLSVGTMSLYRYVESREQLEAGVVSLVFRSVDLTPPKRGSWQRRATALVERMREAVRKHPATVALLMSRGHAAAPVLEWIEALLGVLRDAGFAGDERVIAARAI